MSIPFIRRMKLSSPLIAVLLTAVMTAAYCTGVSFLDLMELKTVDLRFRSRGPVSPGDQVVMAVIDEKSISREGRWVWPRSKIAALIDRLSASGAQVVAFDIGFLEPDDQRVLQALTAVGRTAEQYHLETPEFDRYLEDLTRRSDTDRRLAESIRHAKAKVVLGFFFHMQQDHAAHIRPEAIERLRANARTAMYKLVHYAPGASRRVDLLEASAPQSNIAVIAEATPYSGFFNMVPDPDGVVRWIPAVIRYDGMLYAPMALMAVSAYQGRPLGIRVAEYGIESVQLGDLAIPTNESGHILVNYRGGPKTFPHLSVTDILSGKIGRDRLEGKIVLVGATAEGIYDLRVTPLGTVFPGLEIHANLVDSILRRDFLHRPDWAAIFDLATIVAFGLLLGWLLGRVGVLFGALSSTGVFFGYIVGCQYAFNRNGWVLNIVYPLATILLVYLGITAFRYFSEARQKRFIKSAFSTYLAPSVVKHLIDSPEKLVLGGEDREITAFFSDLQSFTSISEQLSPRQLVILLNEFLTEMTDVILRYEGTVDKFEGDAIIAFFGAPNQLHNHAQIACEATLEMQARLAEMRRGWRAEGRPELFMRVGLHSGPAVVGNMGSKKRWDYTMMGDTVNTAARLEGVNKVYGTYAMIGDTTRQNLDSEQYACRELDTITVVGKSEPVTIYELIGKPGSLNERRQQLLAQYAAGLEAYRRADWDRAAEGFKAVLEMAPDDGPSRSMLLRCQSYALNPPEGEWNGVFTLKIK